MAELTVVRWKRFGKDRLYVNGPGGCRVGWLDLQSGQATVEIAALRAEFDAAVASHRPAPIEPSPSSGAPRPADPRPWTDLALNQPGESLRAQALAEKEAAPKRVLLARIFGVHNQERAWRVGADGEEMVGAQLAKLPDPWQAVHSVPIGDRGADIDHIAIGPGGVYTINTKHHPNASIWIRGDTVKVDGHNQRYVPKARYEAARVSRILSATCGFPVVATGVVAIVGAQGGLTIKAQPADGAVEVLARRHLAKWLRRRGEILSAEAVEAIYGAARRSTTWLGA